MRTHQQKISLAAVALTILLALALTPAPPIDAADHADSPLNASDQAVDQGDTYAFLDPNDNTKLILALTVRGFIPSGQNVNMGAFDHNVRHGFEIETNGDARPDRFIYVNFSPRTAVNAVIQPQTATVTLLDGRQFNAPTTLASLAATAPEPVVTTDATSGVSFYAGMRDDPFFFDIPGFSRFAASATAGAPDLSHLQRGRDTFAGYNIMIIALRIPVSLVRASGANNEIGVQSVTQRRSNQIFLKQGNAAGTGRWVTLDRSATPGINGLIIPFNRKDDFNASTPLEDANGKFAGAIIARLKQLGTSDTNINILANVAVARGDMLRLNFNVSNAGNGGGTNAQAGFPNGRRPADDVVDTLLFFIANQPSGGIGDSVNSNEVTFLNSFPFFAPPHQPRAAGTVDDQTRN
ncbi:MAG TPA: DUF4331 family protein [Pyrinomonadaceae bacterium]|nr:DUF4331 family protein [Pyrinomonadaceae bacterium]